MIADDGDRQDHEAAMVARELMDRGEVCRMSVLCPLTCGAMAGGVLTKIHIEASLVLSFHGESLEKRKGAWSRCSMLPSPVVSTDIIKSERRRNEFLRCPELVSWTSRNLRSGTRERAVSSCTSCGLNLTETRPAHLLVTATPTAARR